MKRLKTPKKEGMFNGNGVLEKVGGDPMGSKIAS